jgi:pimeloyl-ACP methyl ester carboxylesterase
MIGHGQSTIPNPTTVVQMPIEAAIVNEICVSLRSKGNALGVAFEKIIYIGHSYGVLTGIAAARVYPNFTDIMVLTGWSVSPAIPSPLRALQIEPASLVNARFENFPLGYLTSGNKTGRKDIFYGGAFDPRIADMDFELEDVMTTGEAGSFVDALQPADTFTGKVFAMNGENDVLYCNSVNGPCAEQLTNSRAYVPNAVVF